MAIAAEAGTLRAMTRKCEVCENFRPDEAFDPEKKLVEVPFGSRLVVLCRGHARIAENSGVTSFEQLRAFYGSGRRSFVPRRRRDESSQPGERRRRGGRRATDAAS